MPKRPNDVMELELSDFKKTYGEFRLIKTIDMARLHSPNKYQYEHKYRLYRDAADAAIKGLDEISRIMQAVPESYKRDIMQSQPFRIFSDDILRGKKLLERRERGPEFNSVAFDLYSQMLIEGIRGVMATMPIEFSELLQKQIDPFLITMQSISAFARANNPKTKVPAFTIPSDLQKKNEKKD